MRKIWKIKSPAVSLRDNLSVDLGISKHLAQLLINRDISTPSAAKNFLYPELANLHDAELLPDIAKARGRILKALKEKQEVLIFSDYDADGITALAVLKTAFSRLGLRHEHYLPHRLDEGYGLSSHFVKSAHKKGIKLVITLDCGITNFKEIEELARLKIDTVVVDHHQPLGDKLPAAYAIVNPKRTDSNYPFRELSGVGLSYKLASFLLCDTLEDELDLVCLGTVADVVPLLGENRIIVKEGLEKITNTRRPGLKSLIEVAGIKNKKMTTQYISYCLAPRINACGRISSSEPALSLLLSSSQGEAKSLAGQLHLNNQQRQRIEGQIMDEALDRLEKEIDFSKERVIVLYQDGWHRGVLGIVAAKISDKYHRPTVIISFTDGLGRGSARSIENFHLFESLTLCQEYLQGFGGHKHAAGLSILRKDIENFKNGINKVAFEKLAYEDLLPALPIDIELKLEDLNERLLDEIGMLEPFGQDNPEPLFFSRSLKIKSKPLVLGRDTLKFWVSDGKLTLPAIGFGKGDYFDLVSSVQEIDIAYRISLDNWQGNQQLQLEVEDIRLPQ